jgi:putative transposase
LERDKALARFQLIRPFLEDGVPLTRIALERGLSIRTAQEWVQRYRAAGLMGLARRARADRGTRRCVPAPLQQLIEGLALRVPRASIAAIHRQVLAVAKDHHWDAPSYGTVYSIVRSLDPGLVTLAHHGPVTYAQAFDLLFRHEADHPNAMWQADHTQLDIWLLDDHHQPARPWLTTILDDYSRAVAGYYLTFAAPSAIGTALALHQAIWRKAGARWHVCGIPATFYTDHGSDFTSTHIEQVAADLGMQLVCSQPGQPRGRGKVERFFGTVNQLLLSELPGYAPQGAVAAAPSLTLPALDMRFHAWLLDTYHDKVHSETGQAPAHRWEAGGFLPRMPASLEQLDLLLLTVAKARKVHPDGIRFQGYRYIDATLAAYVGEGVVVRYDPRDLAEVRIYHAGAFVCRAVCPDLAGETVSLKEIITARNRRRRELSAEIQDRRAVVEDLLALRRHELPPPEEIAPEAGTPEKPKLKRYLHE